MNYIGIYKKLIMKRLVNPVPNGVYHERHHIVPRSEGGSDDEGNIIRLTAREHYVAHLLLAKIYDDYKMHNAVIFMQTGRHKNRIFKFNSHLYKKIREEYAKKISKSKKGIHFYNNGKIEVRRFKCPDGFVPGRMPFSPQHCKRISDCAKKRIGWKHSEKKKEKMSISAKGNKACMGLHWFNNSQIEIHALECPPGFVPGRMKRKKQ